MYEPVTVTSHDGILGQYFCAVIFSLSPKWPKLCRVGR